MLCQDNLTLTSWPDFILMNIRQNFKEVVKGKGGYLVNTLIDKEE